MTEKAGFVSGRASFTIESNNSSSTPIISASVSAFFSTFESNEMSVQYNKLNILQRNALTNILVPRL